MKWKEFDRTYRVRWRQIVQISHRPFWVYYTRKLSPALYTEYQYLGNTKSFSLAKWLQLQTMVLLFATWEHVPHSYRVKHAKQYQNWCSGL